MTGNQPNPPGNFAVAARLIAAVAMCSTAMALASDYPPPPGPYPSGPLSMSGVDGPTTRARPPVAPPAGSADRQGQPLPAAPEDAVRDKSGATTLFGSAPPPAKSAPPPTPVFAPTAAAARQPSSRTSGGSVDAVPPQAGAATDDMPERAIPRAPISSYPPNPATTAGSDYRPPAYPVGPGPSPYARPIATQQPWRGQAEVPAPSPAGGPVFRPSGE